MHVAMLDLLEGIARGNFHQQPGGINVMKVGDLLTSAHLLDDELDHIVGVRQPSVVKSGHVTNWVGATGLVQQWSLWNRHGRTEDTRDDFSYVMTGRRAPAGAPTLDAFVRAMPHVANMRLNCIHPGAGLAPHEEHLPISLPDDRVALRGRFHLPIHTNPDAVVYTDGEWRHLEEGRVYFFNNGCVHAARNDGDEPRYHLVWDMLLTVEALTTMFEVGNRFFEVDIQDVPVSFTEPVGEYAPSGGMSEQEFANRKLVVHP